MSGTVTPLWKRVLLGMLSTGVSSRDSCTSCYELVWFITTCTEVHHFDSSAESTYLRSVSVMSVVMFAIHSRNVSHTSAVYFPSMKLITEEHTIPEFNVYIVGPSAWTHLPRNYWLSTSKPPIHIFPRRFETKYVSQPSNTSGLINYKTLACQPIC